MLTPLLPFDAVSLHTAKNPRYITFLLLCEAAVKQTVWLCVFEIFAIGYFICSL